MPGIKLCVETPVLICMNGIRIYKPHVDSFPYAALDLNYETSPPSWFEWVGMKSASCVLIHRPIRYKWIVQMYEIDISYLCTTSVYNINWWNINQSNHKTSYLSHRNTINIEQIMVNFSLYIDEDSVTIFRVNVSCQIQSAISCTRRCRRPTFTLQALFRVFCK